MDDFAEQMGWHLETSSGWVLVDLWYREEMNKGGEG
jgi:hypothetical protein